MVSQGWYRLGLLSYRPSLHPSQTAGERSSEDGCGVSRSASIRNIDLRPA